MKIRFTQMYRVTVFLPAQPASLCRDTLDAVQGIVRLGDGKYELVHWTVDGVTERFRPLESAKPARGRTGSLHEETGQWLVFLLPRKVAVLERVLRDAVLAVHPWEAPGVTVDEVLLPLKEEE